MMGRNGYCRAMEPIPLSAAVAEIRRELKIAVETADDHIALEVREVELELTLELGRHAGGAGGVAVLGVSVDGDRSRSDVQLHRIRLVLHPTVVGSGRHEDSRTLRLSSIVPDDSPSQAD